MTVDEAIPNETRLTLDERFENIWGILKLHIHGLDKNQIKSLHHMGAVCGFVLAQDVIEGKISHDDAKAFFLVCEKQMNDVTEAMRAKKRAGL